MSGRRNGWRSTLCRGSFLLAGVAMAALTRASLAAQTGRADLQGVWKAVRAVPSLKPLSGNVPFTAEGLRRYQANRKLQAKGAFDDYDITNSRCSSPGVPRMMLTPMRFKIWQQQDVVTFDFEWNQAIRQVDLRGIPTEAPLVPDMAGTSKGHWEGATLVAVTTDFSERTLIDDLIPHSDAVKVTERFRLSEADTLEDRVTIEDPKIFTRPWSAVLVYKRQPSAIFAQDICLDRHDAHQPAIPAS